MKGQKAKVLYISYLGLLEPIPKSQVLAYLFELSKDVDIHLLTFEKKWLMRKKFDEFKRLEEAVRKKGILWHRLTYHKYPLVVSSVLDIILGIIFSFFYIVRFKISIIHARSNIPIAIGYVLKTLLPVKLLYDRRGIMGEDHAEHSGWKKGGYLYRLAIWFEKKAIRQSDAIVVLTQKVNAQLRNTVNSNRDIPIETIPCCIDLQLFKHNGDSELKDKMGLSGKFVLIYSGSVGTYNLLNEMLDFFSEVLKLLPNAHFIILTQNKEAVLNSIHRYEGMDKDRVTVDYVSQEELPIFLSMADVGLVFRRTSSTAIAASPTKFGEYLACGLPVISTPQIGDLEEIINSNKIGVVLSGYGKHEYREAINKLLFLLAERGSLKQRCRKIAQDFFSLERGSRTYLNVYNHLMGS